MPVHEWGIWISDVFRLVEKIEQIHEHYAGDHKPFDLSRSGKWWPWLQRKFKDHWMPGETVLSMLNVRHEVETLPAEPLLSEAKNTVDWTETYDDAE